MSAEQNSKVVEICKLLEIDPSKLQELKIKYQPGFAFDPVSRRPTSPSWNVTVVTSERVPMENQASSNESLSPSTEARV